MCSLLLSLVYGCAHSPSLGCACCSSLGCDGTCSPSLGHSILYVCGSLSYRCVLSLADRCMLSLMHSHACSPSLGHIFPISHMWLCMIPTSLSVTLSRGTYFLSLSVAPSFLSWSRFCALFLSHALLAVTCSLSVASSSLWHGHALFLSLEHSVSVCAGLPVALSMGLCHARAHSD